MTGRCTDPETGALLHAYELRALDEDEMERFEIHLLTCRDCFEEVQTFEKAAGLLRDDKEIAEMLSGGKGELSSRRRMINYLWPKTPFLFKPAVAFFIIVLLLCPAWLGLRSSPANKIRSVQTLTFIPLRSAGVPSYSLSSGKDLLLDFVYENAQEDKSYRIAILSEDNREIYRDNSFSGFNEYRRGQILLPPSSLKIGIYRLVIEDAQFPSPLERQEYFYKIVP